MVKIYSTAVCPWCVKAKDYLKKKGVDFVEYNVQEDEEAKKEMIAKSKQMGVPTLDINGTIVVGFDRPAIDAALNK
ncbi:MAG: glutaredoxin family protein [Sarcina sp.]